jgi:hypothetical protein
VLAMLRIAIVQRIIKNNYDGDGQPGGKPRVLREQCESQHRDYGRAEECHSGSAFARRSAGVSCRNPLFIAFGFEMLVETDVDSGAGQAGKVLQGS